MKNKTVVIVEEDRLALGLIQDTLDEAGTRYQICATTQDAWDAIRTNPDITNVIVRINAPNIDGCLLAQRIRAVRSAEQLPILMIVGENQLEHAGNALEAGANDVLIDPFEARELRMRMNIHVTSQRRRVDTAHPIANQAETASAKTPTGEKDPVQTSVTYSEDGVRYERVSNLVVPAFDPVSMRFTYGASEEQVAAWKNDESVTKVALDQIMVCPCCSAVPTFRLGCGTCGSAWTKREALVHHYACAHIGPESEFRKNGDVSCPKCLQKNLVASSDFEVVAGGFACSECETRASEPQLIGHCLSCQHRFPAQEATVVQLTGLHVHRVHEVRSDAVAMPKKRTVTRTSPKETCSG